MKRYPPPSSILTWVQIRCFWMGSRAACGGRNIEGLTLLPKSVHAQSYLGLRLYSGGSLGVNRVWTGYDDNSPGGPVEISEPCQDSHRQGNFSQGNGSVGFRHNEGHFQHCSSPASQNNVQSEAYTQSRIYITREKIDPLGSGGFTAGNGAAFQQVGGHRTTNSCTRHWNPSNSFSENGAGHRPGGYQQKNISPQASLDKFHPGNHGHHWQNSSENNFAHSQAQYQSNVSHHSEVLPQHHLRASSDVHSGEDDDYSDVEGTLEELDALCKEWDLERAVKSMKMLTKRGVGIDLSRYLLLLEACGEAKALTEAKAVHQHIVRFFSHVSVSTLNRILVIYGKCSSMGDAYDVFNNMCERNLTSWDTMISWYARNGLGEEAVDMFSKFKESGLKPDGQMFIGVFDACGVVGDVTEGMLHFDSMSKTYGITPTMAHYVSIVHMFGSAGDLDGALEFIEKMPLEPSVDVWETLMNISRIQGNIELGDRCAQIVEQLDASRLTKETKIGLVPVEDSDTRKKKVKKINPLEQRQHEYRAGDRSHPENDKIYGLLRGMKESMKEAGYIPETRFVLHDIDPEGKEEAIMAHSERLACAYALMTTKPRMPIRIIKNLRVCGDCHNVFKIISKLVGREVIMRDAKRFHHFRDGKCSCNDYW